MWAIQGLGHRVAEAGIEAIVCEIEFVNINAVSNRVDASIRFSISETIIAKINTDYATHLLGHTQSNASATASYVQDFELWCQVWKQELGIIVRVPAGHVVFKAHAKGVFQCGKPWQVTSSRARTASAVG